MLVVALMKKDAEDEARVEDTLSVEPPERYAPTLIAPDDPPMFETKVVGMVVEGLLTEVLEARKSEIGRVEAVPRFNDDEEKVRSALVVEVETEINAFFELTL